MRCIDLTHLISREMPVYPGTEPPRLQRPTPMTGMDFKRPC